jgi:sterol desaturase/sphingolipid hydroxylase (fatty acid hydroxylase superfamily)
LPEWLDRAVGSVLITPSLHRLHHARSATMVNRNFGTIFSVFDRALGTITRSPAAAQFGTGVVDPDGDQQMSLLVALKSPFTLRV